ncbi:MAG TPA: glycosyltransferase [Bacteroidia bacterium]|jgi:glycosyltransferase involved in cell wall biosynthesis|nr:glycosyltransferase [Bacteroidia bacterium]
MKVLFISSWYPNSTNPLKGVFVKKHAGAIKSAGVEIEILALTVSSSKKFFEKKVSKTVDENGIVTHVIELNSRFYKIIHVDLILQFGFLKKYFYKSVKPAFKPDIIHSNVLFPAAIMGYWLSKKEKLPHVITEHWSKVDNFLHKSIYSNVGKKAYNTASFTTVVSEFLRKSLSKHFTDPGKIKVVPNVVNTTTFSFKAKSSNEKLVFCCIANWGNPKRPDLIFKGIHEFSKISNKKIKLIVIGEGSLIEEQKKHKWDFEISYVGNISPDQIAVQLHKSDYFLHASNMETFSIVIAEALATGTPVLASNVGAIPELINEENGLLCNNDIESWTKSIKEITTLSFDNKKISEEAKNYDQEKIGNKFLTIYKSL